MNIILAQSVIHDQLGNSYLSNTDAGFFWSGFGFGLMIFGFGMVLRMARGVVRNDV